MPPNNQAYGGFFGSSGYQTDQDRINAGQMAVSRAPSSGNWTDWITRAREEKKQRDLSSGADQLDFAREKLRVGTANDKDFRFINQAYAADEDLSGRSDLMKLMNEVFMPAYQNQQGFQDEFQADWAQRFAEGPNFDEAMKVLQQLGSSTIGSLNEVGGEIDQATRLAASGAAESGFGVGSGTFDRARMNILGRTGTTVANTIGQAAPQVYDSVLRHHGQQQATGANFLSNLYNNTSGLRDSLFSGRSNIEALRMTQMGQAEGSTANYLARRAAEKANSGGFLKTLGGIAGTALGSFAGPLGAAAGGKLGSSLFGGGGGGSSFGAGYGSNTPGLYDIDPRRG